METKGKILLAIAIIATIVISFSINAVYMISTYGPPKIDSGTDGTSDESDLPEEEDKDTDGDFKIICDDSWDCIRPGENTTASWRFVIPGTDWSNIDWTIKGDSITTIIGTGNSSSCETSDDIEEGDTYEYTCTGTYDGKTVSSTYTLYCLDTWPCAKEVQIPGFEAVALIGLIGVCCILIIHRFHRIFKELPN